MRLRSATLLMLLLVPGCRTARSDWNAPQFSTSPLSVLMALESRGSAMPPTIIETTFRVERTSIPAHVNGVPDSLVAALTTQVSSTFSPAQFGRVVNLVPEATGRRLADEGLGGRVVYWLSPVVLSEDSTRALLYVVRLCGPLCGETSLEYFERGSAGNWVHRKSHLLRVS
jgi:hypothetical protein